MGAYGPWRPAANFRARSLDQDGGRRRRCVGRDREVASLLAPSLQTPWPQRSARKGVASGQRAVWASYSLDSSQYAIHRLLVLSGINTRFFIGMPVPGSWGRPSPDAMTSVEHGEHLPTQLDALGSVTGTHVNAIHQSEVGAPLRMDRSSPCRLQVAGVRAP